MSTLDLIEIDSLRHVPTCCHHILLWLVWLVPRIWIAKLNHFRLWSCLYGAKLVARWSLEMRQTSVLRRLVLFCVRIVHLPILCVASLVRWSWQVLSIAVFLRVIVGRIWQKKARTGLNLHISVEEGVIVLIGIERRNLGRHSSFREKVVLSLRTKLLLFVTRAKTGRIERLRHLLLRVFQRFRSSWRIVLQSSFKLLNSCRFLRTRINIGCLWRDDRLILPPLHLLELFNSMEHITYWLALEMARFLGVLG